MNCEQSPVILNDDIMPSLKAFIADIDDDRGWANDVLMRLYREGKIEAGDVSCDYSLSKGIKHGLIANIMDNGVNDYAYQLTDLGRLYCIKFIPQRDEGLKFKTGDLVTLDPIEYDNYYSLYKIVAIEGKHIAVSLPEDWKSIKCFHDLNKESLLGLIVMNDEINHCTRDEEVSNERSDCR